MSEESPETPEEQGSTCCSVRRKVLVGILSVLSEEQCGVPDAELADFMRFDLESPGGKPVLAFRFCPWCGKERGWDDETRVVDIDIRPPSGDDAPDEPDEPFPPPDDLSGDDS